VKVSIITVVYNNKETVVDSINSVINQTYTNLEFIIIDGGSTDGTLEEINKFSKKITRIVSEADNGIYDAMNKGIQIATGEVIGILNSDDLYSNNNVISEVANCFQEDNNLSILYANLFYVNRKDTTKVVRKWFSKEYYNNFFDHGNVPPHPTLFLRSSVYSIAGYFDCKYKYAADYEFMLRIFKKYNFKILHLNKVIVLMRLGGTTNKSLKNIVNGNIEILDSWKKNSLKFHYSFIILKIIKKVKQYFN
jgi:glycosyltransferase involved in cell wall biosynthesis